MSFPFPFLACFLVFVIVLFFRFRYLRSKRTAMDEEFLDRENRAKATVMPPPKEEEYTVIPLSKFPFGLVDDQEIKDTEARIKELSEEKLLNLNGMSNTDVKLKYGANNFNAVCAAGDRYDEMMSLLLSYATGLDDRGFSKEAAESLVYLIGTGCDMKAPWIALGSIYARTRDYDKLRLLIDQIDASPLSIKKATEEQLRAMLPEDAPYDGSDAPIEEGA